MNFPKMYHTGRQVLYCNQTQQYGYDTIDDLQNPQQYSDAYNDLQLSQNNYGQNSKPSGSNNFLPSRSSNIQRVQNTDTYNQDLPYYSNPLTDQNYKEALHKSNKWKNKQFSHPNQQYAYNNYQNNQQFERQSVLIHKMNGVLEETLQRFTNNFAQINHQNLEHRIQQTKNLFVKQIRLIFSMVCNQNFQMIERIKLQNKKISQTYVFVKNYILSEEKQKLFPDEQVSLKPVPSVKSPTQTTKNKTSKGGFSKNPNTKKSPKDQQGFIIPEQFSFSQIGQNRDDDIFYGQQSYLVEEDSKKQKIHYIKEDKSVRMQFGINITDKQDIIDQELGWISEFTKQFLKENIEYASEAEFKTEKVLKKEILALYKKWKNQLKPIPNEDIQQANSYKMPDRVIQLHITNSVKDQFRQCIPDKQYIIGLKFKNKEFQRQLSKSLNFPLK